MPDHVNQEQVNNNKAQSQVRGTVNAAVLQVKTACPNIFVTYIYDTKTVYLIYNYTYRIAWVEKVIEYRIV